MRHPAYQLLRIILLRRWVNKPLRYCHAEPPAAAVSEKERRFRLLLRCQVVGGHQLDRRPREDALAAVLAPDDAVADVRGERRVEHLDRLEPEGLDSVEQALAGPEQDVGVVGEHEDGGVVGRLLAPPSAPVLVPLAADRPEHVAAHDVGPARSHEPALCRRVGVVRALVAEVPAMDLPAALPQRILPALVRPGDEAVQRDRHVAGRAWHRVLLGHRFPFACLLQPVSAYGDWYNFAPAIFGTVSGDRGWKATITARGARSTSRWRCSAASATSASSCVRRRASPPTSWPTA